MRNILKSIYNEIPHDFQYQTTLAFWTSVIIFLINNQKINELFLPISIMTSITGISMKCNNFLTPSLLLDYNILVRYVFPLLLQLTHYKKKSYKKKQYLIVLLVSLFYLSYIYIVHNKNIFSVYQKNKLIPSFIISMFALLYLN